MATLLCIALLALLPLSGNREATELAARMEARYRGAKTLQATFLERYAENGSLLRSEAGTAYFRRPGKMRWEYERPEKNLFLVDGKTAWFYVPADHTATRVPARQSDDLRTPLALLAGQMKISRACSRVELAENEKPLREGDAVFFEVARDSGELVRLIVRQAGAIEVEFRFENWRFDPALPDSLFRFEPPAGVAIVNGELADGKPQGN